MVSSMVRIDKNGFLQVEYDIGIPVSNTYLGLKLGKGLLAVGKNQEAVVEYDKENQQWNVVARNEMCKFSDYVEVMKKLNGMNEKCEKAM